MKKTLLALFIAGVVSSSASAAVSSYTGWLIDGETLQSEANRTDWGYLPGMGLGTDESSTRFFDIPLFDVALGNLTSVSVTLWGEVGSIFTVSSNNQGNRTATLNSTAFINTDFGRVSVTPFSDFTTGPLAPGETYTSGLVTAEDSITVSFSDLESLSGWIGIGIRSIGTAARGDSYVSGAGNVDSRIETWARASLTVVYTYDERPPTQLPEPASLALLGTGLLGLVAATRRRKA